MSNLWVRARFTENSGDDPATGLTLSDIDMYLLAVHRSSGAITVVWNGTQIPTTEETNIGAYGRMYSGADFETYFYTGGARYTGATVLDSDWVGGAASWGPTPDEIWAAAVRTLTNLAGTPRSNLQEAEVIVAAYTTWNFSITGLGDISNRVSLYFTAKKDLDTNTDSLAILQLKEVKGVGSTLEVIDQIPVDAADSTKGTLTVDDESLGNITITVDETMTNMERYVGDWDVKVVTATDANRIGIGSFAVEPVSTRAIT